MGQRGRLRPDPQDLTIVELAAAYWDHAQRYYRKPDGTPTSTQHRIKMALRGLRRLYAETRAVDFGPTALRAVRQAWIDEGHALKTINDYPLSAAPAGRLADD